MSKVSRKKSSSTYDQAIKRGEGVEVKAGPLRKKELFLKLFFCLLPFENKNYFTLDNLSKYGHITLKFVGRYFYLVVKIFSKNRAILVQKLWGEKKLSKSVFGYFMTKKKIQSSRGGRGVRP